MTATHTMNCRRPAVALYLAFELGWEKWKLAFGPGVGVPVRWRTITARDGKALELEIAKAKARFGLAPDAPVLSCYEAGRDGFWLHRYLLAQGIGNVVVDSASIEVNRRRRRAKSDRLDASKLLEQLLRYHHGERRVWSVVRVPSPADEDRRHLHRDLEEMKAERTRHVNRIRGLLAGWGLSVEVSAHFPMHLAELRTWDGQPVPEELQRRLMREFARWQFVHQQIAEVEHERKQRVCASSEKEVGQVRHLLGLAGIGMNSSWQFVREFFGWRQLQNRRQVAALAGLAPTPYQSGDDHRDQGISKAGNRRLRSMLINVAWGWLRWQPSSRLSRWYQARFGSGTSRMRKIGIVALARKLLVALWRYVERGEVPEGAVIVDWEAKLKGRRVVLVG